MKVLVVCPHGNNFDQCSINFKDLLEKQGYTHATIVTDSNSPLYCYAKSFIEKTDLDCTISPYDVLALDNLFEFVNRIIIINSDKCVSNNMSSLEHRAWIAGIPVRNIYAICNKKVNPNYYISRHITDFITVTTEIREKEVEKIFIKECYYEFLELEEREDNFLQLSIKGSEVNLLLVGTCVTWMEQLLQNNHKEVLTDKYLDYTLTYSRNGNFKKLFQFDGYTGLHSPDERINISESLNALQTKYGHKLDHWHSFEKMGDVIRL